MRPRKFTLPFRFVTACTAAALFTTHLSAQEDKAQRDAAAKEMKAKTAADTTGKLWTKGGTVQLNLTQVSLTNWAAGGFNSIGGVAMFNGFANRHGAKTEWANSMVLAFGGQLLANQGESFDNGSPLKTEDRIELNTKWGRELKKPWYFAALGQFRTQFTEGFPGDPHVLGGTGHPVGHRHGANLGVGKSGLTEQAFEHARSAQAERPRLPRNGRRKLRAPADDGSRYGPPTVSLGRGEDGDGDPAARSQGTTPLAQRRHGVRHVHQAQPTQHRIERGVGEIQLLAVHRAGLDLPEPAFTGDLACQLDDAFRDVGRQHVAARTDPFGGTDGRLARAGGDVEDALPPEPSTEREAPGAAAGDAHAGRGIDGGHGGLGDGGGDDLGGGAGCAEPGADRAFGVDAERGERARAEGLEVFDDEGGGLSGGFDG